jgi:hypothetical protein
VRLSADKIKVRSGEPNIRQAMNTFLDSYLVEMGSKPRKYIAAEHDIVPRKPQG